MELPGEAALADASRTDDRHEAGTAVARGGVEEILQLTQLGVAPDEGGLQALAAVAPAALGHHPEGPPGRHRGHLAFQHLLACLLEDDGPRGGALGRLAHEDGPRWGHRLEAASRVHEIARHHALVRGPNGHRGFAGEDPGAGLDRRPERLHRVEELEARPHGALSVVLSGGGGAPDRHHRVADELLDCPPVALDDVTGELEVAREELAGRLGVAPFGERREAHEIGEEDRHDAALGDRRGGERGGWGVGGGGGRGRARNPRGLRSPGPSEPRPALGAELCTGCIDCATGRTTNRELRPALNTELGPRDVLRPATRADHVGYPPLERHWASVLDGPASGSSEGGRPIPRRPLHQDRPRTPRTECSLTPRTRRGRRSANPQTH